MVRFAEDVDGRPKQLDSLHSIYDPIPEDAVYASSLTLLTSDEVDRNCSLDDGWGTRGKTCIAKELQDEAERRDEVLYPVHIESDAGVALPIQLNWIWAFIDKYLPVSPKECLWHYSGKRSIHAHVPLFVRNEGRKYMKDLVKDCPVDLDDEIYQRKGQFRLPGAVHDDTGFPKVRIDPEWRHGDPEEGHEAIFMEGVQAEPDKPDTYADFLRETFGPDVLEDPTEYLWEPDVGPDIKSEPHHWEPGEPVPDGPMSEKWKAYNRHPFCPHAKAGNGNRSMALVQVIGGAYCHDGDTLLPTEIWAAVSCTGEPWNIDGYSPISLSKPDWEKVDKMGVERFDNLLIIGGKSHRSRIFRLDWEQVHIISNALMDEINPESDADRADTLHAIESCGLDPGSPGKNGPYRDSRDDASYSGPSRAETLQQQAERKGIHTLSHQERLHVGNRLLRTRGVQGAVDWYREQFGSDFDRDLTLKYLKSISDRFLDLPDVSRGHG